jgi:hypothetical protein
MCASVFYMSHQFRGAACINIPEDGTTGSAETCRKELMPRLCLIFSACTQVHVPVLRPQREENPVLTGYDTGGATALTRMVGGTANPALRGIEHPLPGRPSPFFKEIYCTDSI